MPRRFGKYPLDGDYPTRDESYSDGFAVGKGWRDSDDWVPGGPWTFSEAMPSLSQDPDWAAYCAASRENNDAWRAGWAHGRKRS